MEGAQTAGTPRSSEEDRALDRADSPGGPTWNPRALAPRVTSLLDPGGWTLLGAFVLMIVIFGALRPDTFLVWATVKDIMNQSAVPAILVAGLTFVLAAGEFDLSFTAILGMGSGLVVVLMSRASFAPAPAIIVMIAAALLTGLTIGALVALTRASSFIVTLAIGSALTGLELALTNDQTIYSGIPAGYGGIATNRLLGLEQQIWIAAAVALLCGVLLHGSRFGRHVTATGANPTAAFLAGVRVRRVRVLCFVIVALCAAVAAVLFTSQSVSYIPGTSAGFLLSSYAAVFLGAAAGRGGGRFTVGGAVFGVVWFTTLDTGLTYLNAAAWSTNVVQGIALTIAVLVAARGRQQP